jgi:hypothetical protein
VISVVSVVKRSPFCSRLDEWKETVRTKLDNLEHILATIQANFSLSWQDLLETVQITGWLILLLGYFILFFLESGLWKH